jgi:hypothetical protein
MEGRQMPNQSNDPAEIWRTFLAEFERNANNIANQAMGSQEFSRVMNQASGATVGAQKAFGDMMERYLASTNLPSRAQLTNIGERLQAIESQLSEIKALLNRIHGDDRPASPAASLAPPRPPRTKRPPSMTGGGSA